MKLNDLALIIVLFIIVTFLLSTFNIISVAITDILAYSLLVIGVALVYTETIRQNRPSVFIGSIIFLFGVYFLITENFNLKITDTVYVPIILIFGGAGLLMLYISTSPNKIFLFISIIFLTAGITLIVANSHWGIKSFFLSILPVLNFFLPVIIIFLLLIFIMRVK
ncbi:MAG: hypothetical protein OQK56_02505 [Ignavibacteriaceae bacterium]|jgi:hypothetical protein|nr:hypothetical protein [Ignavibacteriaceae bacterium]